MTHNSDGDSYSPSLSSLGAASSESSFTSNSDSVSTSPSMPGLMPSDNSDDRERSSANGLEGGGSADLQGGDEGVGEGIPALDAHMHQSSLANGEQGGITSTTTERVGLMLRATALSGVFRSGFLAERPRDDAPPAASSAQGEQPERFLDPVSLEFMEIGRELFHLGREQRRIEQVERRLIERATELLRTNQWLNDGGQESELSDDEEGHAQL